MVSITDTSNELLRLPASISVRYLSKLENSQRTLGHDAQPHRSTSSGAKPHLSRSRDRISERIALFQQQNESVVALNINFPTNELLPIVLKRRSCFSDLFASNMKGISKESGEEGFFDVANRWTLVDHCGVIQPCNWHVHLPQRGFLRGNGKHLKKGYFLRDLGEVYKYRVERNESSGNWNRYLIRSFGIFTWQ